MAVFPTYESQGQISTNLPAPERHEAAEKFKAIEEGNVLSIYKEDGVGAVSISCYCVPSTNDFDLNVSA